MRGTDPDPAPGLLLLILLLVLLLKLLLRYEVVIAIVSTAKKDFDIVSRSEDLLNFVKERTLDKKFKIRKEAMAGGGAEKIATCFSRSLPSWVLK